MSNQTKTRLDPVKLCLNTLGLAFIILIFSIIGKACGANDSRQLSQLNQTTWMIRK